MKSEVKRIPIAEFRKQGYLRELNRRFLHPLGLAMEVVDNDDGSESLGGVWDYREDPEGMQYLPEVLSDAAREQSERIDREIDSKRSAREALFGAAIQPYR